MVADQPTQGPCLDPEDCNRMHFVLIGPKQPHTKSPSTAVGAALQVVPSLSHPVRIHGGSGQGMGGPQ